MQPAQTSAAGSDTETLPRRSVNPRQWPGERDPTRWDVHDANADLANTFLERFRVALLHGEGSEDDVSVAASESVVDSLDSSTTVINRFCFAKDA